MNMSVCVCVRNKNLETHQHISQKGCICIFSMPVGHYDKHNFILAMSKQHAKTGGLH